MSVLGQLALHSENKAGPGHFVTSRQQIVKSCEQMRVAIVFPFHKAWGTPYLARDQATPRSSKEPARPSAQGADLE